MSALIEDPISAYVDETVARLELKAYIRGFNEPGGGKIASFSDFNVAVDLKRGLGERYDAARHAAPGSPARFDEAMRACLEPVIVSTFLEAALEESRIWAFEVATSDPSDHGANGAFPDVDAWIKWVVENVERDLMIGGPYGEPVLEDDALDRLLGRALRAEAAAAVDAGWLPRRDVVRLVPRQGAPA